MTRPRWSRNRYTPGWSGRARRCSRRRSAGAVFDGHRVLQPIVRAGPVRNSGACYRLLVYAVKENDASPGRDSRPLSCAAPASANYRVGISEQDARVFDQPAWQALKLKRVRYVVAWDYYKDPGQVAETTTFMNARRARATRTCW